MNVLDLKPGIWRISKKGNTSECNYLCAEDRAENVKALAGFISIRSDLRVILEKELPKIFEDSNAWIDPDNSAIVASKITMLIKSLLEKEGK